jgi:hypothetical protein
MESCRWYEGQHLQRWIWWSVELCEEALQKFFLSIRHEREKKVEKNTTNEVRFWSGKNPSGIGQNPPAFCLQECWFSSCFFVEMDQYNLTNTILWRQLCGISLLDGFVAHSKLTTTPLCILELRVSIDPSNAFILVTIWQVPTKSWVLQSEQSPINRKPPVTSLIGASVCLESDLGGSMETGTEGICNTMLNNLWSHRKGSSVSSEPGRRGFRGKLS